jgi:hypothetical protein
MKVTVEIADEDVCILEKFMRKDQIELSKLVQVWTVNFVQYMKDIALASEAGIELTVDEVQKMQRKSIANSLASAKKIVNIRKTRSE